MKCNLIGCTALLVALSAGVLIQTAWPQDKPPADPQPIYRVTVISRTLQAINYEHRNGPTKIDFQGTVLLPKARGDATVESKRGRISVDAKFEHIEPPTKFGREYLTYVLWAITPQGRPKNLGELVVDPSDKTKISVTTDLQALGLMVTAEPYYSVTTPSDVVVLENIVRPDTVGRVEEVTAKYDLLPRGQYTLNVNPNQLRSIGPEAEKLPYDRYEAVLELYQAQNAIQIARSLGADRFAADTLSKAETLLGEAQSLQARRQDTHMIVSRAREAAQMAEDARMIAIKRRDQDRLSSERQQELEESRARTRAEVDAAEARARAADEQAAAEAERAAAAQARFEAEQARNQRAQQAPPIEGNSSPRSQTRFELLNRINSIMPTRDTSRGLVTTVPDYTLETSPHNPAPAASGKIASIAGVLTLYPGVLVRAEGYADDRGSELEARTFSQRSAEAVRDILVLNGVPPGAVTASGYGKSHPVASNATESGRQQNRRVEIVIAGQPIGEQAYRH